MAIHANLVSAGTTATLVYETPDGVETCLVVNATPGIVIGDSSVTTSTGYEFTTPTGSSNPDSFPVTLNRFTGALYAVAPSGQATVNVWYIAGDVE